MGQFTFSVTAFGSDGCDRRAKPGDRLFNRCGKFGCPDCMAYDFVQQMKQKGVTVGLATFTHRPNTESQVIDDLVTNTRTVGEL